MKGRRGHGGWTFLALVLAAHAAFALIAPEQVREALAAFLPMLRSIAPALAFTFALLFLADLFLTPARVEGWLGRRSGLHGWLLAAAGGMLSSGPIYAWYALLGELRRKGMKTALVAVFLYARAIKLPLLPLMAHYFGVQYTVLLTLFLVAFSILSGLAMGRLDRPEEPR